ncbi:MAG: hypothetical protein E6G64_02365 [Actinobacteria bacterium]|nr:MAG: hypothetical protein E6G64_02365 [Actinomycetota bacterium]
MSVRDSSWGNLPVPPDPLSADADERLCRWLRALVATPGLTAIRDLEEARRVLLDDSLRGAELVRSFDGPLVDVGSGGGVPGIPLAYALPDREVTLLEGLAIGGVLVTMVDGRTRLSAEVEDEVRRHFGDLVFKTAVPRSVRLAEAPSFGLPAIAYDRRSRGADAARLSAPNGRCAQAPAGVSRWMNRHTFGTR